MNQKQKRFVHISYYIYYVVLAIAALYCYRYRPDSLAMGVVAAFTCFLVPLVLKVFRLKPTFEVYMINIVFAAVASIAGSMLGAYRIPFFDKVLHFSSGLFMTQLSYMLFCYLKNTIHIQKKNEKWLSFLFINACNMLTAVYWEFFEYGCLVFLQNDAINHYTTGVHDSITDMIAACIGGYLVSLCIYHHFKTGKENFWTKTNMRFFELNFTS